MALSRKIKKVTPRTFKKQESGLVEYGGGGEIAGGAFSGAATGASAGAMFGPWGIAIGGLAGGAIGAFTASKQQQNENDIKKQDALLQGIAAGKLGQSMVNNPYADTFMAAMGGYVKPNVEVEGGEVIQNKRGSLAKVIGPKHSQGGVQLYMEDGGRVYSDKLIDPVTGLTFAEAVKRYM